MPRTKKKTDEEDVKKIFKNPEIKRQIREQFDSIFGDDGTISQLRDQIVKHKKNKKIHWVDI